MNDSIVATATIARVIGQVMSHISQPTGRLQQPLFVQ